MKKLIAIGLIATLAFSLTGCNSLNRIYGGTISIDVPAGQKYVNGSWDEKHNFWYSTRPMHSDEKPETFTVYESSNLGLLQGKVVLTEHK